MIVSDALIRLKAIQDHIESHRGARHFYPKALYVGLHLRHTPEPTVSRGRFLTLLAEHFESAASYPLKGDPLTSEVRVVRFPARKAFGRLLHNLTVTPAKWWREFCPGLADIRLISASDKLPAPPLPPVAATAVFTLISTPSDLPARRRQRAFVSYLAANGFKPAALEYQCGPMRDRVEVSPAPLELIAQFNPVYRCEEYCLVTDGAAASSVVLTLAS